MRDELFIGITSWNSELFLGACLKSVLTNTRGLRVKIVVMDNCSGDQSAQIAKQHGVALVQQKMNQPEALNALMNMSKAKHTLLIHADVVLLSPQWHALCAAKISDSVVFVSPQDIGCGPMTRNFGRGHPESSFMFFDTDAIKAMRQWKQLRRRFRVPYKFGRRFDFYANHVTHSIAENLTKHGKSWHMMAVSPSRSLPEIVYQPSWSTSEPSPSQWLPELAHLEYGLGNFYSLDNVVTHYHNWYDRIEARTKNTSAATTEPNNQGYPVDFVRAYSRRFIHDYDNDQINLPEVLYDR